MFFDMDAQNAERLAPKLTERHITSPPFTNMRVRPATQVLSHTVAAGESASEVMTTLTAHHILNPVNIFTLSSALFL